MSLNSMIMAETMPDEGILDAFEKLEQAHNSLLVDFAELIHCAYHRGCLRQQVRCIVRYMFHHNCSYEEAASFFNDPLLMDHKLREEVEKYYPIYLRVHAMSESSNKSKENANIEQSVL